MQSTWKLEQSSKGGPSTRGHRTWERVRLTLGMNAVEEEGTTYETLSRSRKELGFIHLKSFITRDVARDKEDRLQ